MKTAIIERLGSIRLYYNNFEQCHHGFSHGKGQRSRYTPQVRKNFHLNYETLDKNYKDLRIDFTK